MSSMASQITGFTGCLLNRLFRRKWKKSKLHVTGLCEGNSPATGEFPAQRPVTRKKFPFYYVIMPQGRWHGQGNTKHCSIWCILCRVSSVYVCLLAALTPCIIYYGCLGKATSILISHVLVWQRALHSETEEQWYPPWLFPHTFPSVNKTSFPIILEVTGRRLKYTRLDCMGNGCGIH